MDAQKQIDQEVDDFHASQRAHELKEHTARLEHRRQLDQVLTDKKKNEERQKERNQAEEEEIEIFAAAKRVSITLMISLHCNVYSLSLSSRK